MTAPESDPSPASRPDAAGVASSQENGNNGVLWFCLRTEPKHEHIAATNLAKMVPGIRIFNPRLRIRKATRRGLVWFNDPLFPAYLLAAFDLELQLSRVMHIPSVRGLVRFGNGIPTISDGAIQELRRDFDENDIHVVGDDIAVGDTVNITKGPLTGASAVVLRVLSGQQRVQVLMEMLGQSVPVEVPRDGLIVEE